MWVGVLACCKEDTYKKTSVATTDYSIHDIDFLFFSNLLFLSILILDIHLLESTTHNRITSQGFLFGYTNINFSFIYHLSNIQGIASDEFVVACY